MAVTAHTIMDSNHTTIVKYVCDGSANSAVSLLDVSGLVGHSAGSLVNISKIFWTTDGLATGYEILWDASSNVQAIILHGSGTYGMTGGQPALTNNAGGGITGDVVITNASGTGSFVIEYHKVQNVANTHWAG